MLRPVLIALMLFAGPVWAAERVVAPGDGTLAAAIATAAPGDVLRLAPGTHRGPVVLEKPLTLDGGGQATLDGGGQGSVITIIGEGAVVRGLVIQGSGSEHGTIDSGVQIKSTAKGALIENNRLIGNLYGVDAHGGRDCIVRGNLIEGRRDRRVNDRGNGVYVWNAPGLVVQDNVIDWGRDGIFVSISRKATFIGNRFTNLRFAVHYMYAHDSTISGNVSVGNGLGFALMYSERLQVHDNISLADRAHGLMLNYANNSDIQGNLVRGSEKCLFIYNANRNIIADNRFEGCDIGIHFTAGSERNAITGNAFVANRTQVKYVGTRDVEWSVEGRGNYWSDHPAFDLNGDGIADSPFRPNDLMDHILWSQPAAALLTGAPVVQLVRWSQSSFPATLPGGVVDSAPLMTPRTIPVRPDDAAAESAALAARAAQGTEHEQFDPLTAH
ncbi:MAG TPA: nitrous oxide reductase family maturation protein NosD [Paracoccus sp. (in: a-proteobacteria)]|nr:nitrous oxide reductase family maturation protein NosD [Paracoccus sp. (in: a-proteobacteria)]